MVVRAKEWKSTNFRIKYWLKLGTTRMTTFFIYSIPHRSSVRKQPKKDLRQKRCQRLDVVSTGSFDYELFPSRGAAINQTYGELCTNADVATQHEDHTKSYLGDGSCHDVKEFIDHLASTQAPVAPFALAVHRSDIVDKGSH